MLWLLLTRLLFAAASPAVFEADCEDLVSGRGPATLIYRQIEIRRDGGGYSLSMHDTRNHSQRYLRVQWDGHLKQHVARSSNGEDWTFMQTPAGGLRLQIFNWQLNCERLPDAAPVARDAFDKKPYDTEFLWQTIREAAGGCGVGLVKDGL